MTEEQWSKRQITDLSIMKIQDGGFVVYEDNHDGFPRKLLFADGDISIALQYVRDKLVPLK